MNASKIAKAIGASKLTKAEIAEKCNITRRTLDNVLSGADAKISTIEALARALKVKISFFFDEEECRNETHGDNSPIGYVNTITHTTTGELELLRERVRSLEARLKDKEEIIDLLKARLAPC